MADNYRIIVDTTIKENNKYNERRQKTGWVTEKKGAVAVRSEFAPEWISGNLVIRGKLYSVLPWSMLPLRTMFMGQPVKIGKELFWLEVKGYGFSGKELYFQEHVSGDIYYGMYLENAKREFERLNLAHDLGLFVPLPIAVVEIPREEYIKKGMPGFKKRLRGELSLSAGLNLGKIEKLIGEVDKFNPGEISQKLITAAGKKYPDDPVEAVRFLIAGLSNPKKMGYGMNDAADALLSGRKVGYLIRATRCPIRVGDPSDKNIDTPQFREVAKSAGKSFKVLLEHGIIHHCPGTGNWTIAGELTDFSDTFDLKGEWPKLEIHINGLKQDKRIKKADIPTFVEYLIGPPHAGLLCPYFLEGMFGGRISSEEAVKKLVKLF